MQLFAGLTTTSACDIAWNQQPNLLPPAGGWRGSTIGRDPLNMGGTLGDEQDPAAWEAKYGKPLHILRLFLGKGASLTDGQVAWTRKGGILFISVTNLWDVWGDVGLVDMDSHIDSLVGLFKLVAPAQMWITLRYEPALYAVETQSGGVTNTNGKYYGTPAEYRAMWHYVQDHFDAAGVTNAVWVMDYSTAAHDATYHPLMAALWPADVTHPVHWLVRAPRVEPQHAARTHAAPMHTLHLHICSNMHMHAM